MMTFAKSAIVAVALATAGMTASTGTAAAGDLGFSIYIGSGGHHRHWDGPRRHRSFCSPNRALRKARRMGIHRARVVRANRRVVKVRGHRHGHRVRAVFANTWRCPVVRYR